MVQRWCTGADAVAVVKMPVLLVEVVMVAVMCVSALAPSAIKTSVPAICLDAVVWLSKLSPLSSMLTASLNSFQVCVKPEGR